MTRKRDDVLAIALSLSVALILLSCQPAVATEGKLPAMAQSPHIQVAPPLPGPLSMGVAVIQFRAENVKLIPVYGAAATSVVPRIGHLHITVDGANWHWVHANDEPIVIQGLSSGTHRVLFELADANHKVLESESVDFEIPTAVR